MVTPTRAGLSHKLCFPGQCKLSIFSHTLNTMTKKAIVLLADGAEEMEFTIAGMPFLPFFLHKRNLRVSTVDVLRRAKVEVLVAGVKLKNATFAECSRGVKIVPDVEFEHQGQSWKPVSGLLVFIYTYIDMAPRMIMTRLLCQAVCKVHSPFATTQMFKI